jgi:MFS family permease
MKQVKEKTQALADQPAKAHLVTAKKRQPTNDEKVDMSLKMSTSEGIFNAASTSINSTFITPLALHLGANNSDVGLLSAVQNLANTISQIPGAKMTNYYSRKSIWMLGQLTSKIFLWLPVVFLSLFAFEHSIMLLLAVMALIAFFAGLRNPAWTSMMGDLVPLKIRGRYFGMRNMVTGIAGVVMTLVSGWIVTVYGFSVIFVLSIVISAISIIFFLKMYEPPVRKVFHYKHSFGIHPSHWMTSLKINRPLVIFTLYLMLMYFAVEIASPFYTVYMLRDMHIDYFWFSVLTILGAVIRIVSFKYWGRLEDKFGSRKILLVVGFFGCFTPFLWLFVSSIGEIALVKIFDGFIWAGFDLIVFNYLLDITPANKRPVYIANHSFFVGLLVTAGDLTGGLLAHSLDSTTFMIWHGLQIVFLISFVLRLCVLVILPKIREVEVKQRDVYPVKYVFWQSMAVEPAHGIKHALSFTFRYPETFVKDVEKSVKKVEYKMKVKGLF